jgi:2-polyprenyl-3-methyl-5-hydroxy-6-metoxy-1,4-benzoquinol methylase
MRDQFDAHRHCVICGQKTIRMLFTTQDRNRKVDSREFVIVRCDTCGAGQTLPQLSSEELSRYYTHEYYSLDNTISLEIALRPHNQSRMRRVQRYVGTGRLIDIGAGTGMFLKTAQEFGFQVEGLEISAEAAAFGRQTWGLNIRQGNLHNTVLANDAFDVVSLWHVFEHLHDPHRAAQQLFQIMKSGGLLVIAVPNFASLQARIFHSRWFHLDVPRHLFHFTPESLVLLLEQTGLKVLDVYHFSAEHNWAGILGSVMELSRPGEGLLHKLIRKAIGTPIARTLALFESAVQSGGTFEIFAQKP